MYRTASKKIAIWDKLGVESRWSPYLLTSINTISFNFEYENNRLLLKEHVEVRMLSIGIKKEDVDMLISNLASKITTKDLDENYLIPNELLEFCKLNKIELKLMLDDYYKFIFSDYGKVILKYREKHKLSQKELAKILSVCPNNIFEWETKKSYPIVNHLTIRYINGLTSKIISTVLECGDLLALY